MSAAKAYKGIGMEGSLARWYDRTTRKAMPEFCMLAERIAPLVPAGGSILEIAPGPGFLSIELARRGFNVQSVDISETFVAIARRNAAAAGVTVRFERGNAAALPAEDASVDFVVCRAAFKNFAAPVAALSEMRRVLKPGGTALLIDMRRDVAMADVQRYVARLGVGWLDRQHFPHVNQASLPACRDSAHDRGCRLERDEDRDGAPGFRSLDVKAAGRFRGLI